MVERAYASEGPLLWPNISYFLATSIHHHNAWTANIENIWGLKPSTHYPFGKLKFNVGKVT